MAKNVLIVDDSDATRRILMRGVREAAGTHADLDCADGGQLRAVANRAFDLILPDAATDAGGAKQPLAPAPFREIFGPFLK
jgi:CheY-like chemotaxis protein